MYNRVEQILQYIKSELGDNLYKELRIKKSWGSNTSLTTLLSFVNIVTLFKVVFLRHFKAKHLNDYSKSTLSIEFEIEYIAIRRWIITISVWKLNCWDGRIMTEEELTLDIHSRVGVKLYSNMFEQCYKKTGPRIIYSLRFIP